MSGTRDSIDAVLRDLRELGGAIGGIDLGYPVDAATFSPPASADQVRTLAGRLLAPLPPDYAYFLSRCRGFAGMDFHNGYAVHGPELVLRILSEPGAPKWVRTNTSSLPTIPVASDGGGDVFLLDLGSPYTVRRWGHGIGSDRDEVPDADPCLRTLCQGFLAFLGADS